MKDLSFFLLKNTFGAKMKKGIRNFCNGDGSTSTLNQQNPPLINSPHYLDSTNLAESPPTLEEMVLQLELEEELARKSKLYQDYGHYDALQHRRMSCVNNSDILRSARNALNQYPRFSLDGKDSMYRSTFRNFSPSPLSTTTAGRKSICCDHRLRDRFNKNDFESKLETSICLPTTLAGERVTWCKPGVVAKLMGLEAIPVPIRRNQSSRERLISSIVKKQNTRRIAERHEMERRPRFVLGVNGCGGIKRGNVGSCSKTGYRVMNPIAVEPVDGGAGWPTRRFL